MSATDLRTDQPHSARMYDYYLGGRDNYASHRAARFLTEHGVRQFLDIGTGIPTSPNLHEVAQEVAADARVVYVDRDPVVLVHASALMRSSPEGRTAYI